MNKSIYPLELIFNLNERLFRNSLEGVTDDMASQRISDHSNPLVWIATHTVWARYNMSKYLGNPGKNPYQNLFEGFKPFDESMKFDSIEKIKEEWSKASELLKATITKLSEEGLSGNGFKNPTGDETREGTISFLAEHESYDIGQMGFLKKYLTKEAMSYS